MLEFNEKQGLNPKSAEMPWTFQHLGCVDKYKLKTAADQKQDLDRLHQMYNEKNANNQSKINQGIQVLRKRHTQETQRLHHQHQQQIRAQRLPEQMAQAQWSDLQQRLQQKVITVGANRTRMRSTYVIFS